MDYIFRWIQIRFLSGHQLDLFAGLSPQNQGHSIPVEGTVTAPANTVNLSASASPLLSSQSEEDGLAFGYDSHEHIHPTTPPQQGIAPDLSARSGLDTEIPTMEDRGLYHVADAMKSMYDMGDSPSCATCGAIMTRSGSCYRCMSCGSTSGCS
jgi:ribonucleoside-diphosphate reductase alpha chain